MNLRQFPWVLTFASVLLVGTGIFIVWFTGYSPVLFKEDVSQETRGDFHGFDWGDTSETIQGRLGSPDAVRPIFQSANRTSGEIHLYRDRQKLGYDVSIELFFHSKKGLVKGVYGFPLKQRDDCVDVFLEILGHYKDKLDRDPEVKTPSTLDVPICDAVQVGEAAHQARLGTPPNETVVGVVMGNAQNSGRIVVHVESPNYYSWVN